MNSFVYRSAVTACGKAGMWESALALLAEAAAAGLPCDARAATSAITACAQAARWKEALTVVHDMRRQSQQLGPARVPPPDAVLYTLAVAACRSAGQHSAALDLLALVRADRVPVTPQLANGMLQCAAASSTDSAAAAALELVSELERSVAAATAAAAAVPRTTAAGAAATPAQLQFGFSLAATALGNVGQWQAALQLLPRLTAAGASPDAQLFSVLMTACSKAGAWQQVLPLLRSMQSDYAISPSIVSYTVAAVGLAACRRRAEALQLLRDMRSAEMPRDAAVYAAVISACTGISSSGTSTSTAAATAAATATTAGGADEHKSEQPAWALAASLARAAVADGVHSARVWNAALSACAEAGASREAAALLHEAGSAADDTSYVLLALTQRRARQPELALSTLRAAPGRCLQGLDLEIALLGQLQRTDEALQLLASAKRGGYSSSVVPAASSYTAALGACAAAGDAHSAELLLRELHSAGLPVTAKVYEALAEVYAAAGLWQQAVAVLTSMAAAGLPPTAVCAANAARACLTAGQWRVTVDTVTNFFAQSSSSTSSSGCSKRSGAVQRPLAAAAAAAAVAELYSLALKACASGGLAQEAIFLLDSMPAAGVQCSAQLYELALKACAKAGSSAAAAAVQARLTAISSSSSSSSSSSDTTTAAAAAAAAADLSTLCSRVRAHCAEQQWRAALSLLPAISSSSSSSAGSDAPPVMLAAAYSSLLRAAEELGSLQAVLSVLDSSEQHCTEPLSPAFAAQAVAALIEFGALTAARELLLRWTNSGSSSSSSSRSSAVSNCYGEAWGLLAAAQQSDAQCSALAVESLQYQAAAAAAAAAAVVDDEQKPAT
jgi:trimeric autotransporter adhesin